MSDPKEAKKPATPLPAASILIVRDGPLRADGRRLEILMTERRGTMRVAGGAYVFPGGKVEPQDKSPSMRRSFPQYRDIDYRISAIREAFEESGVLLARSILGKRALGRPPLSRSTQTAVIRHHRLGAGGADFLSLLASSGLAPAVETLIPFAHWITPVVREWRFDTRFYLAPMPKTQTVVHDGGEAVSAFWARPEELADRYGNDVSVLMFPTRTSLKLLAKAHTVSDALAIARRRPAVPITPVLEKREDGIWAHVPAEADIGGVLLPFSLKKP